MNDVERHKDEAHVVPDHHDCHGRDQPLGDLKHRLNAIDPGDDRRLLGLLARSKESSRMTWVSSSLVKAKR